MLFTNCFVSKIDTLRSESPHRMPSGCARLMPMPCTYPTPLRLCVGTAPRSQGYPYNATEMPYTHSNSAVGIDFVFIIASDLTPCLLHSTFPPLISPTLLYPPHLLPTTLSSSHPPTIPFSIRSPIHESDPPLYIRCMHLRYPLGHGIKMCYRKHVPGYTKTNLFSYPFAPKIYPSSVAQQQCHYTTNLPAKVIHFVRLCNSMVPKNTFFCAKIYTFSFKPTRSLEDRCAVRS